MNPAPGTGGGAGNPGRRSSRAEGARASAGDLRQHDVRGVRGVVVDRLVGDLAAALQPELAAGVGIHVEPREVAATDVEPDAVPGRKDVRRRVEREGELVDLARL